MDANNMSNLLFEDQCVMMGEWFDNWNDCERMVSLMTVFHKLKGVQLRFMSYVLSQFEDKYPDTHIKVNQANCAAFVSGLANMDKKVAILRLLESFLLLRPDNHPCKIEYINILEKVLQHSVTHNVEIEECKQLLSYCIIHPAFNSSERNRFRDKFMKALGELVGGQPGLVNLDALRQLTAVAAVSKLNFTRTSREAMSAALCLNPAVINALPMPILGGVNGYTGRAILAANANKVVAPKKEKLPLTTPLLLDVSDSYGQCINPLENPLTESMKCFSSDLDWHRRDTSKNNNPLHYVPTQSVTYADMAASVCVDNNRSLMSPQSSIASSGSDELAHTLSMAASSGRNTFEEPGSGMRDVLGWLKYLRLHKYAPLFQHLTYDEMMNMTDHWLDDRNVTKGARHRILECIEQLKARPKYLRDVEKRLHSFGDVNACMYQLNLIMNSPIKPLLDFDGSCENVPPTADFRAPQAVQVNGNSIAMEDIAGFMTFLMGKICSRFVTEFQPDQNTLESYLQLVARMVVHEAWSHVNKSKLTAWKSQVEAIIHHTRGFRRPSKPSKQNGAYFPGVPPTRQQRGMPPLASASQTIAPPYPAMGAANFYAEDFNTMSANAVWSNYCNGGGPFGPIAMPVEHQNPNVWDTRSYNSAQQTTRNPLLEKYSMNPAIIAPSASRYMPYFTQNGDNNASDTNSLDQSLGPEAAASMDALCHAVAEKAITDTPEKWPMDGLGKMP